MADYAAQDAKYKKMLIRSGRLKDTTLTDIKNN